MILVKNLGMQGGFKHELLEQVKSSFHIRFKTLIRAVHFSRSYFVISSI